MTTEEFGMKTDKRIFRTALCLILAAVLGCSSTAFADPGDPGFLMETQTDLNGDGTPERLELFETSSGEYAVKAYLAFESGAMELNLTPALAKACFMIFADKVRDQDKKLAAVLYTLSLDDEPTPTPEPTPAPTPEPTPEIIQPGYRFTFGRYEQDSFTCNGPDPIVWRVLDTDETTGNVLIMSEYGLHTMQYNHRGVYTEWKDSDVRNWLNSDFFASAFTEKEIDLIVRTEVSGSDDAVFMLNADEIRKYLREPYLCYASVWAREHNQPGAYINENTLASSWLVRMDATDKLVDFVGGGGKLYVPAEGSKGKNYLTTEDNVVRPVMWVKREAVGEEVSGYDFTLYARAVDDIATRSGPTTGYNGLANFSVNGQWVHVLSRVYDGSIWWLQVEFEYDHKLVRCYTGLQRIDIPIDRVPDEATAPIATGTVIRQVEAATYGPGDDYRGLKDQFIPSAGTVGQIYAHENGYYFLEYQAPEYLVRIWLPEDAVTVD